MSFKGKDRNAKQSMRAGGVAMALLISAFLSASPAWSQNPAEAEKLERLRQQLVSLEQGREQLEERVEALQASLRDVQSRPSPEQAELAQAQAALEQARAAQAASPSEVNASRVQNAEFKLALSERRFAKSNTEAAELQARIEDLQAQIQANSDETSRTRALVTSQQAAVARLQQQRLAQARKAREEQQQQLELQRNEAAAAQLEIRRLRAMLEAREAEAQRQAQTAAPVEASEQAMPQTAGARATAGSADSILLSDRSAVVAALTAMQQRVGNLDPRRAPVNLILHVKHGDDSEVHTLKALSNDQYRGQARLTQGARELVVGFNRWQIEVPTSGDYVFLYNAADEKQPELLIYNAQLEN